MGTARLCVKPDESRSPTSKPIPKALATTAAARRKAAPRRRRGSRDERLCGPGASARRGESSGGGPAAPRNRIVYLAEEFPSVRYLLQAQPDTEVEVVPDLDALLEAIDERTLLVPVSHVVGPAELPQLLWRALVTDQVEEIRCFRTHPSSSSSASESRRRPLRVRVFTVPSGMAR